MTPQAPHLGGVPGGHGRGLRWPGGGGGVPREWARAGLMRGVRGSTVTCVWGVSCFTTAFFRIVKRCQSGETDACVAEGDVRCCLRPVVARPAHAPVQGPHLWLILSFVTADRPPGLRTASRGAGPGFFLETETPATLGGRSYMES